MNANHNTALINSQEVLCQSLPEDMQTRHYSNFDSASHREFVELLRGLRKVSLRSDNDALTSEHKHHIRRSVLALSTILADARTLIAGETLPEIPNGFLASMEHDLIAMDYRDNDTPATLLFKELDLIQRRAEALMNGLMKFN